MPAGGYSAGTIFLQVVPSFRGFQEAIRREAKLSNKALQDAQERNQRELAEKDKRAAERRGNDSGGAYARSLKKALDNAVRDIGKRKIDIDSSPAEARLQVLRAQLESLRDNKAKLDLDPTAFDAAFARIKGELADLSKGTTEAHIRVEIARALAELGVVDRELDKIDGRNAKAKVSVSGLGRLRKELNDNGNSFRAFNGYLLAGAGLLPLIAPAATAAAGGLLALGSAAVIGGAGLGVLAVGFTGISDAFTKYDAYIKQLPKDTLAASKAIRTAAKGLRDAEQGVADARVQAARAADDAARRVSEAVRQQRDAEKNLQRAQVDAREAQEQLTRARAEAQQKLIDLRLQIRGGALDERQAILDLFEAQVSYNNAMADGAATRKDREEADIALQRAKLNLEQVQASNKDLAKEQEKAAKAGVDGSDEVVAAQKNVKDATDRVAEAQQGLKDAADGVKQAQIDQQRAAEDSARSMRDATESLADAQASYQEALQKTGDIGSAAFTNMQDAFKKLGPEGQRFVKFLHDDLLPNMYTLRAAFGKGMFPGLEDGLKSLAVYAPGLNSFFTTMGKVWGDIFRSIGQGLTNPVWMSFFKSMGENVPVFTKLWADLAGNLATIFAQIVQAFAPLGKDFLEFLVDATARLSKFLASAEGQDAMERFMDTVRRVGPIVAKLLGALGRALVTLGKALEPYGEMLAKGLTDFLTFIANMDPDKLGAIAIGLLALVFAAQTLFGLSTLVQSFLALEKIVGLAALAFDGFTISAGAAIGITAGVVIGLFLLAAIFVVAYKRSETFRDIVNAAFGAVGTAFSFIWNSIIKPIFKAFVGTVKFLGAVFYSVFDLIVKTFKKFFSMAADEWKKFTAPGGTGHFLVTFWDEVVKPAWSKFIDFVQYLWDKIQSILGKGVFFVVETILNDGLIDGFNWLADKVGSKPIPRIDLPASFGRQDGDPKPTMRKAGFASGGLIPGFSPHDRADNIPAMLTAGEYVLPVKAVKRLRAQYGDDFLEQLRRGSAYANGGLVAFGRELQKRGFRVSENPAFGGVHPVHAKNSLHYSGQAIDVNFGPGGRSREETAAINGILGLARQYGLRTIWQAPGHYDHAHFDTGGGKSILGSIWGGVTGAADAVWDGTKFVGGKLKDAAGKVVGAPVEYLLGKMRDLYNGLPDNGFTGMLKGAAETLAKAAGQKLVDAINGFGDAPDAPTVTSGPVQDIVRSAASARGWDTGSQWDALAWIIQHESGFNPNAQNPRSTAYGLFQLLDSTWAGTGFTKSSDPAIQTAAGLKYIADRYGDPIKAKAFWESHGYYADGGMVGDEAPTLYDSGGWLQPGLTTVLNASGKPEPVFSAQQWEKIERGGLGGGPLVGQITIPVKTDANPDDIADALLFATRRIRRGGVYAGRA